MKKLYTIGMGLSFALMASQAFAQVEKIPGNSNEVTKKTVGVDSAIKFEGNTRKDDPVVYWTEDFSNGFGGQLEGTANGDPNGSWTTGEEQGNLWFVSYPIDQPNGYDRTLPLDNPAYNNTLPNFFGTQQVIQSATRDNGFMMLDVDRYNSDATDPDDVGSAHNLENPVQASLISPVIDLSSVGPNVVLTFSQKLRQNGANAAASVEVSTDGGSSWVPYQLNPDGVSNTIFQAPVAINISEALSTATNGLTNCKIRFFWALDATVYYWFIDDIAISELPSNDLKIGKTYYNDYDALLPGFENGPVTAAEYYNEFEYNNQADYLVRPFNFGAVVSNVGAATQTGVIVHVDATLPDGSIVTDYAMTDPMDIEPGAVDTIFTADIMPDASLTGMYTFDYYVSQNEEDQVMNNNDGMTQTATITTDADNDGFAITSNDARISGSSAYTQFGQDVIWGVPYVFPETTSGTAKYITHVECVLFTAPGFAETLPGELIYFNVREGSVLEEDVADPSTTTTVFFDANNPTDYAAADLEHEITEAEIWNADNGDPVWVSFELPSPILIDANTVYQAEYRVPAAGGDIVFSTLALKNETYAGVLYQIATGTWSYLGTNSVAIRFRTNQVLSVEKISEENGMQLVQNYPNPFTTSTKIQYRIEETSQASLEVRDLTGKLVFNKDLGMVVGATANTYELQRGNLAPGLYTYSIVTSSNTITRKLTVQ